MNELDLLVESAREQFAHSAAITVSRHSDVFCRHWRFSDQIGYLVTKKRLLSHLYSLASTSLPLM